jgi:hypothetical protein
MTVAAVMKEILSVLHPSFLTNRVKGSQSINLHLIAAGYFGLTF